MNKRKKQDKLLALAYCVLIVIGTFSLVHGWFPQLYRHVYITTAIIVISLVLVPRYFLSNQNVLILIYALIVFLNYKRGDEYANGKELLDGLVLMSCASMTWYFLNYDDQRAKWFVVVTSLVIVIIDTIGTFSAFLVQPDIVRALLYEMQDLEDSSALINYYKFALVEYEVLHGLPVLVPPLVMWIRSKKTCFPWKIMSGITLIAIMLILYAGDATTPLLLAIFAFIVSFLIIEGNHRKSVQRLILVTMFITPFVISDSVMTNVLSTASKVTSGELHQKVEDALRSIKTKQVEGDMSVRSELYGNSLNAFFENPLLGVNENTNLGGHSAFFDRLGAFGLVGVIPWVLFIFVFIRYVYKMLPISVRDFFLIGAFCFIALMVLKNMSYFYTWFSFMVLLPVMLTLNVEKCIKLK